MISTLPAYKSANVGRFVDASRVHILKIDNVVKFAPLLLAAAIGQPLSIAAATAASTATSAAASATQPGLIPSVPPTSAKPWQRTYLRICHAVWGADVVGAHVTVAPCATLAAQIQQESGWNCAARSRVGALGCAQFMPATARQYADEQGIVAPADPRWSFRAQHRYMHDLWSTTRAADPCERIKLTLGQYNGGPGWQRRDAALAVQRGLDPGYWTSLTQVNAGRSQINKRENNEYPGRVIRFEPAYIKARWGQGLCQ
ncbi:MAG: transglycosylase SLT domain-containing protein [Betaproteobacteria bacterium]|nr:transglycosylase SLT domain-containing protein [Betaproteobacteria bacterium]